MGRSTSRTPPTSGSGWMDSCQQAAERRLAGSRGADDREPLTWAQVEVDAVQDVMAFAVGVSDVLSADVFVDRPLVADTPVRRHVRYADQSRQ